MKLRTKGKEKKFYEPGMKFIYPDPGVSASEPGSFVFRLFS
jgi:hypothetical protein